MKEIALTSGIYQIVRISDRCVLYVGSGQNVKHRWIDHQRALRLGKHYNTYLQRIWNKYGESDFEFGLLEECEIPVLIEREQAWHDALRPRCNLGAFVDNPMRGRKWSDAARRKMSLARKGKKRKTPVSDETRLKLSKLGMGRTPTEETRLKLGLINRGKKISVEQRKKLSDALRGRKHSEEHVRKVANANRGAKRSEDARARMTLARLLRGPVSEKTRRKMSDARRRRGPTPEATRIKMSQAQKGRKPSDATRIKISQTQKGRKFSDEHRRKISEARRGKPMPPETKRRLLEVNTGRPSPMKGHHLSDDHRRKLSAAGVDLGFKMPYDSGNK